MPQLERIVAIWWHYAKT